MKKLFNKKRISSQTNKGFTLVEVLVSITLFTVVAITGITAVIVAKSAYEKNQSIKAVSDSLMFVMDDISRTARLGNLFRCVDIAGNLSINLETIETPLDGNSCEGFAYEPFWDAQSGDPIDQIIYVFAPTETGGALFARSINDTATGGSININGDHFQRITPASMNIDLTRSGFDIVGTDPDSGVQPRVIVRIHGTISEHGKDTELSLQTTISQRAIFID